MKLSDFKGIFTTNDIQVKSVDTLPDGYLSVTLQSGRLDWRPGEHGIFTLPDKAVTEKKWRAFSIASTPDEGVIRIGTKASNPPSDFKAQLMQLKPGDTVNIRGPFGWFTVQDDTSPVILVAGGSGITAARAVLSKALESPKRKVHLIHSASDYHLYQKEVEKQKTDNLDLHFTKESSVALSIVNDLAAEYGSEAYYYVSGPPKMNSAYVARLKELGIKKDRVIVDPYMGFSI